MMNLRKIIVMFLIIASILIYEVLLDLLESGMMERLCMGFIIGKSTAVNSGS